MSKDKPVLDETAQYYFDLAHSRLNEIHKVEAELANTKRERDINAEALRILANQFASSLPSSDPEWLIAKTTEIAAVFYEAELNAKEKHT